MSERMKPPTRRTGRTLGGAKKGTPPPPPPVAELTAEQYAAEQTTAQGEGHSAADEPQAQPAPSAARLQASAWGRTEAAAAVAQSSSAQPTVEIAPSSPEAATESFVETMERQVAHVAPAAKPAAPSPQPTQPADPVAQHGSSQVTSAAANAAQAIEVALRPAVPPVSGGTAFPVRTHGLGSHQEQDARSQETPSDGTPWARGPGRPKDIPETAVVLNQRIIMRESLDSAVPAALRLKKRIKRFALDNELDRLPLGDIVSVALDEWLTARGF
ncbi:hypothetical protein [Streptomyces sp. TRM70350]|uniref:hypothetical protein n=1 Tax=Streptomyces sp. TRM70350 TaxID=2856165 RepID=UPI001C4830D1|nr:hypothetical protein [Streptomyces sp. TRM70350]MBV7699677.1 hypothetical protein [Streptomyces sp. TRM70350]